MIKLIYIFKEKELFGTLNAEFSVHWHNQSRHKSFPTDSISYDSYRKQWYVKRTRAQMRPLPDGMVPKELKMCLLLLGIH